MKYLLPLCLLYFAISATARNTSTDSIITPILTTKDTVFIKTLNSELFVLHKIKKGQTVSRIMKFYNVPSSTLAFMPTLVAAEGKEIPIPIKKESLLRVKDSTYQPKRFAKVFYRVKPDETVYRIAKVYFNVPLDSLRRRNRLTNDAIKPGQSLHIGWLPLSGIQEVKDTAKLATKPATTNTATKNSDLFIWHEKEKAAYAAAALKGTEQIDKGVAFWDKKDTKALKNNKMFFALHRTAPIGSVLKIKNPMKNRILYVKCSGRLPPNYPPDIMVLLSPFTAKTLGALDARFYVQVHYFK